MSLLNLLHVLGLFKELQHISCGMFFNFNAKIHFLNGCLCFFLCVFFITTKVYCEGLENQKFFTAQLQALRMLPLFLTQPKILNEFILPSIHQMIVNSFPAKSIHAFEASKTEWKDYVNRLDALLG